MRPIQRMAFLLALALLLAGVAIHVQNKPGALGGSQPTAYMLVIHESEDDGPAEARVIDDQGWREIADSAGVRWVVVDKDEASRRWPTSVKVAEQAGLPAIVWLDEKGKATAEKLPLMVRGMRQTVRKHTGGKDTAVPEATVSVDVQSSGVDVQTPDVSVQVTQ